MNEYGKALQCHEGQAGEKGVIYAQGLASAEQIIHFQFRYFCTESADGWSCGIFPTSSSGLPVKDIITYVRKDVLREALRLCISPAPVLATLVTSLYCITVRKKRKREKIFQFSTEF